MNTVVFKTEDLKERNNHMIRIKPCYAVKLDAHRLLFTCQENNILYQLDLNTALVSSITLLQENCCMPNKIGRIVRSGEKLYGMPLVSRDLTIYDIQTGEIEHIELPQRITDEIDDGKFAFFSGCFYRDYLYMFGYSYRGIIKYNIKNKTIEEIPVSQGFARQYYSGDGFFHVSYLREGDTVFFPFQNSNAVLEFNLITDSFTVHSVGSQNQRYISIEKIGERVFLIPRDGSTGSVVVWNLNTGEVNEYNNYPDGFNRHKYAFYKSIVIDGKIVMLAHMGNMNICFDPTDMKMSRFLDFYDSSDINSAKYAVIYKEETNVHFLTPKGLVTWNYLTGDKCIKSYTYTKETIERIHEIEMKKGLMDMMSKRTKPIIYENDVASVNTYIGALLDL
ncbi:MAG: hypothetical protein K6G69_03230 [Lachnospiraceae bacterium]|nr:hypothetical protein [Lachnospiraceae bacterium]